MCIRGGDAWELGERMREETGLEPFFVTGHYGRASQLGFYLPGRPTVYCAAGAIGGSSRQYDHWLETDLSRADVNARLLGRPAVILTGGGEHLQHAWSGAFGSIEVVGPLPGEPKANRTTLIGRDCVGFAPPGAARDTADTSPRAEPAPRSP